VRIVPQNNKNEMNALQTKSKIRRYFGGDECRRALLIVGVLLAAVAPTLCLAQVQLPSVNLGDPNFEDGIALSGWILEVFPEIYVAGDRWDSHGNRVAGTNRLTTYTTTRHVAFETQKRVLGGRLAAEILQPLVDLDVQLANGTSTRVRGLGDLIFGPGVPWRPRKLGHGTFADRFVFAVSDRRAVNVGNHFVFVDLYYAVTYERKKIEVNARVHYLWNSANKDPSVGLRIGNIQPGQAFHANYAASYEVLNKVRLGFNDYRLQLRTADRINDVTLSYSKERTVGLGTGFQLKSGYVRVHLKLHRKGSLQSSQWNQSHLADLKSYSGRRL
jgi:hypothetical protein